MSWRSGTSASPWSPSGRLQKGQPVAVKGVLHQNVYDDKDGNTKYEHEIVVDREAGIQTLNRKTPNGNGGSSSKATQASTDEVEAEATPF